MAQQYVTPNGTLTVPGAYSSYTVQSNFSGLATNGVLVIMGEADQGPDYTLETDLRDNAFGPDQLGNVVAKYGSGNLVNAFLAASTASNDPQITGSFVSAILVKTNVSTKASGTLPKIGGGTYSTLYSKNYGKAGNMIYYSVTATAEVRPTVTFTWIPNVGTVDLSIRVNGAAAVAPAQFTANTAPSAFVTAIDALSGVDSTGGAQRTVIPGVSGNLTLTASGNQITIDYTSTWTTTPSVGDTLTISESAPISVIKGGSNQNVGAYVVTSATSSQIVATKLSDAGKSGASIGVITAPANVGSVAVASTSDFRVFAPVTVTGTSSTVIDGVGKTLEINELTSGTDTLTRCAYALSTTGVTWISKTGAPKIIESATEYQTALSVNRQSDNISETFNAGGKVALNIGYTGTTATLTITDTELTTSVTGGSGANLSVTLADWATIADLVAYINTQTGYTATAGTAALGQLSPVLLDNVTAMGICSTFGGKTGKVKIDGYDFYNELNASSLVVENSPAAQAASGLPDVKSSTFMTGGTKGGTTDTIISSALTKLEEVECNFVIPCFSRDASLDITDGLTESSSTYTIDSINQATKNHVVKMAGFLFQKPRQAFLSYRNTYTLVKNQAGNLANYRASLCFMDHKYSARTGIIQGQPWIAAAQAAGMQAAGFYKLLVNKLVSTTGAVQAAGDFKDSNVTSVTDALKAGLLFTKRLPTGGYAWVSDQTTYSRDSNFVYNSIQAVYIADIVAQTTRQRIESAFVGQTLSEVDASLVLSQMVNIMSDLMKLRLIAKSDDAPRGFRNLTINIAGPALLISCEIKLATGIYFAPISFLVSQVQQTSSVSA